MSFGVVSGVGLDMGVLDFGGDRRKLNGLTTKDKFLLPKIDTCLDTLNGCKFFSTCDLHWEY